MALELQRLCKHVGADVHLYDVSLSLAAGSFNVLLGAASAGKTTLLRLLAGLDRPTSGSIRLHDTDITALGVRERDVAFVYQQFVNYPTLTVFENIASPMRVRKQSNDQIKSTVGRLSELLGISDLIERQPQSLSGGQQQRVAIARALAKDAKVVLLDEPLANLDFKLREELLRELPRLFEGTDKIVVYAATDPNEAFLLGGNTVILDCGAISQVGPAETIFQRPLNLVAAEALSEFPLNLMPVSLVGDTIKISDQSRFDVPAHLEELPDGDYVLVFRAEHLSIDTPTATTAKCDAVVTVTEITGNETIIHAQIAGNACVAVVAGTAELTTGQRVDMFLDVEQLFASDLGGRIMAFPDLNHAIRASS